jgi:uncharacterized protein DUF1844
LPENKDSKDHKDQPDEAFKVVDRRLFTAEGELREEAVQQERKERMAAEAAAKTPSKPSAPQAAAKQEAPQALAAFKNLVGLLAENAVMYAGAYTDPQTGQPLVEPEALRNIIDMLDALREKTQGNLAPEEDAMILDLSGKLKMTYLELSKAAAQPVRGKAKARP